MDRRDCLKALADMLGKPVVAVCAAGHGLGATNIGRAGARAVLELVEREVDSDGVAILLVGESGHPVFLDQVSRSLRQRKLDVTAVVPYRVAGVFTGLALAADRVLMHPNGGLGAFDRPLFGRRVVALQGDCVEALAGLPEWLRADESKALGVAREHREACLQARLVGSILSSKRDGAAKQAIVEALSYAALGAELAVGAEELAALGLEVEVMGEGASLAWQAYESYEKLFELLDKQEPLFSESGVANEVEFAPARGLIGAVVEGQRGELRYELDTGQPDPDTGMLQGQWSWSELARR